MKNLLIIKNLNKSYSDFKLTNINFKIPTGHIVGILGENGAGKTTIIKAILNLIKVDSGDVEIFEHNNIKYEEKIKSKIGVVLDDSFLPGYYNPNDINRVMKIMYNNWDENMFFSYIDKFKLPRDKEIKKFSKGMYIKMKIATVLSHKPKLLILDEPTSGLDPIARSDMLDILEKYVKENNASILISSHITSDLERIADEVIFVNEGKIILYKSREELFNDYLLIRCSEEEFNKISKSDYIKYKKNRFEYLVLVSKDYDNIYNLSMDKPTLEDIMLLYIRGEK